jgi:hypothetical protein
MNLWNESLQPLRDGAQYAARLSLSNQVILYGLKKGKKNLIYPRNRLWWPIVRC